MRERRNGELLRRWNADWFEVLAGRLQELSQLDGLLSQPQVHERKIMRLAEALEQMRRNEA